MAKIAPKAPIDFSDCAWLARPHFVKREEAFLPAPIVSRAFRIARQNHESGPRVDADKLQTQADALIDQPALARRHFNRFAAAPDARGRAWGDTRVAMALRQYIARPLVQDDVGRSRDCSVDGHPRLMMFGGGIHYCLCARLAPLELETALDTLLTRLPNLRLTNLDNLQWHPRNTLRGVPSLMATR